MSIRDTGRWLARELTANQDGIKALSAPQLGNSSIEAGQIEEYDADGALVSVVGEQFDGTHTAATLGGPVPPEPVPPVPTPGPGQLAVRWSGKFVDDVLSPMDFSHVAVHVSRDDMLDPDNTTQVGTITGGSGDGILLQLDPGDWSVLLVAVSQAGKWSDPSEPVLVAVPDADVLTDLQDTVVQLDADLQDVQLSVDGKTAITNATVDPAVNGTTVGDRWQKWTTLAAGGKLIGSWRWTGSEWLIESLDPSYLPLIDIGAGTFGLLSGGRLVAKSVTAATLEALLVLASDIIAGDPAGAHARMTPTGLRVLAPVDGGAPAEVIRMGGAMGNDLLAVTGADGTQKASLDAMGNLTAQNLDVDQDIVINGDSYQASMEAMPKGVIAWNQFAPPSGGWPTLGSSGGEVGLFEIGWATPEANARMYAVNVPPILLKSLSGSVGTHGLVMRMTTDGTPPSIPGNSQIVGRSYGYAVNGGCASAGFNNVLVSSKNGPYIRIMVSLFATVASSIDGTLVQVSVDDKGLQLPTTGSVTTGGVTPPTTPAVAPPADPVVRKTVTYSSTSVQSFQGNNTRYDYNAGKGYQGLSPAGYGNTKSLWTFPSLTGLLAGATVNKIEAYFYFEHWYNNAGGSARIVAHGNSGQPTTYSSLILAITSPNWPRGAGRWVTIPSSLYAGFKSGTYKGFGLEGDGTYNTYGIANAAKIRVTYTK